MSCREFFRAISVLSLAVVAATGSSLALAQQSPALDRVSVWLGGYYSSNDTTVTAQGTGNYAGIEGKLNFEDDLGLKQHSVDPRAYSILEKLPGVIGGAHRL